MVPIRSHGNHLGYLLATLDTKVTGNESLTKVLTAKEWINRGNGLGKVTEGAPLLQGLLYCRVEVWVIRGDGRLETGQDLAVAPN